MLFSESRKLANCGRRRRSWLHSADVRICDRLSSSVHRKSVCLDQGILGLLNCERVFCMLVENFTFCSPVSVQVVERCCNLVQDSI